MDEGFAVTSLYVVGGRQRELRPLRAGQRPWQGYDRGLVLQVDPMSTSVSTCFEYVSPHDVLAGHEAAISLQASAIEDGRLYTCTETEVMVYELPQFGLVHYVSLPLFNDVHHVRPTPAGNIAVANAGLEMVLEITPDGQVVNLWNVLGEDPWLRFDPARDYRMVSTKPHRAHPNFVFYIGTEPWATRFHQGDAISLEQPGRSIQVSSERIHDGVLHDDHIYFTSVDGKIVIADARSLQIAEIVDLTTLHEDRAVLGWCRGVLVDGDCIWVGFSRIRPTRFRENVSWIARGLQRDRPTRIACFNLASRACVVEIELESMGLGAVYSILPRSAD